MDTITTPEIGHNAVTLPGRAEWLEYVQAETDEVRRRVLDITVGAKQLPAEIDDDNSGLVLDFIAQAKAGLRDLEKARKVWKGKTDDLSDTVQKDVLGLVDPAKKALGKAQKALDTYTQEKARAAEAERRRAEAERREAEARALAAQEEADRAAQGATAGSQGREEAVAAQEAAVKAQADAAAAKDAQREADDQARVRGEYGGSVAFVKKRWVFEVTDVGALPVMFVKADEQAIREYLRDATKGGGQPEEVPGVQFRLEHTTQVRG